MTELNRNNARVIKFDYPKKNDYYWNRYNHKIEQAVCAMEEKFVILEHGFELENEKPTH